MEVNNHAGPENLDREDQKKIVMKYFDYAESAVKKFIALYLDKSPESLFNDYSEEHDVISFEYKGDYLSCYLSCEPKNMLSVNNNRVSASSVDLNEIKDNENLKKAVGMLFNSVYFVYPVLVKIANDNKLENLFPFFHEDNLSFEYRMANQYLHKKEQALNELYELQKQYKKIEQNFSAEANEIRNRLLTLHTDIINRLNANKQELIDDQEKVCNEFNSKKNIDLFIVIEKNAKATEKNIYNRLYKINEKYQDLD